MTNRLHDDMIRRSIIQINPDLFIPLNEVRFLFSTSGGPGGQHANRSATRVSLLFDVANSPSLNDEQRQALLEKLGARVDRQGILHIHVQESRSQHRNRRRAIERFRELIAGSLIEPKKRRPTTPGRAARKRRLERKKKRSQLKRDRSRKWTDNS